MSKLRFAIGAAAAGLLVTALAWRAFDERAPAPGPGAQVAPARNEATPQPSAAELEPAQALRAAPDHAKPARVTAESSAAPAPAEPPASGRLRARVRDGEGRPIEGVPVALFGLVDGRSLPAERVVTDGAGEARFELAFYDEKDQLPPAIVFSVGVQLPLDEPIGQELGTTLPEPGDSERVVELALTEAALAWLRPLRVQAVDPAGRPAVGLPLVFLSRHGASDDTDDLGLAVTEPPDGIASFDRGEQIEGLFFARYLQLNPSHEVALRGPFLPEPAVAVPAEPTDELLRLTLPPTGSVAVRALDAEGTPVRGGAIASLSWHPRGGGDRGGYLRQPIEDGEARFERVGLGLDLRVGASLDDGSVEAAAVDVAGPDAAGQVVAVEVPLGPALPVLVGRLVDEHGEPLAQQRFQLALYLRDPHPSNPEGGPRRIDYAFDGTDGEGRFRHPWAGKLPGEPAFFRVQEHYPRAGPPPGWIPRFADAPFPAAGSGGEWQLGDLELRDVPVVASGRVLDPGGAPVNQAWISARIPSGDSWRNFNFVSTTGSSRLASDAQGRFAIRAIDVPQALRLSASRSGLGTSPTLDVVPGAEGIELVLEPEEDTALTRGSVYGSLRIDPDVPLLEIEVALQGPRGRRDTLPLGGVFRIDKLHPGSYRLELSTADTELPLHTIDGLQVRAGERCTDPRLQGIDLRGRLRTLALRLQTAPGEPLQRGSVRLEIGAEGDWVRTTEEGRLRALVRAEDHTITVRVQGYEPLVVNWGPEEQHLLLTPSPD